MIHRRHFLRASAATAAGCSVSHLLTDGAAAVDFSEPVKEAAGLTVYHGDGSVHVRFDNLPIVSYRAQSSLKYPYFAPLNGPESGLSLTAESAIPYPHHRGLWLGCDPLNGGNYWADDGLESGQIRADECSIDKDKMTATSVSFSQDCHWQREGSHPLSDERQYTVSRPNDRHVIIDCDFRLTAYEDISIKKAKHSFFAMRAAADISPSYGGTLVNSSGSEGAKGTYGKVADWCGYFGRRRLRPDVTEGIVIMNHPDNFGGNCPWFTRDYGHLSPSPFNFLEEPWTMSGGATLELRYRAVLFVGTPAEAGLKQVYQDWIRRA